jgi:hypothetical protein
MRKFLYVAEVKIDEARYQEVLGWGIDPTKFIDSVLSDHGRDRGLLMETATYETVESIFDPITDEAEELIENFLMEDLEFEILNNRMCLGGNCEI